MIKDMYFCINPVGQKIKTSGLTMTQYSTNAVLHLVSVGRYDNVEVSFRYPNGRVSDQYHMALVGKYQLRDSDTEPMMTQNADDLYEYSMPIPYKVTSSTVQGTSARINVGFSCFKYDPNTAMQVQIAVANTQIIMNASTDSDTIDEGYKQTEVDNLWKTVNKQANDIDEIKGGKFTLNDAMINGGVISNAELNNVTVNGTILNLSRYAVKTDVSNEIDGKINELATVAKTGEYDDLLDKPELFSGKYSDLTDKPIIPSIAGLASTEYVENAISSAVSSVYKYKGSVKDYASLPRSNVAYGDVYNVESDGMNYAWTGSSWDALGSNVDLSGYYNKTQIDSKLDEKASSASTYTKTEVASLPISTFANDKGYLTSHQSLSAYSTTDETKALPISTFKNDKGYLVESDISDYAKSSDVNALPISTFKNDADYATNAQVNEKISSITKIQVTVVESLPDSGQLGNIYLLAHQHNDGEADAYDEYMWVPSTGKFEKIGNTDIDLSNYVTKDDSRLTDPRKNPNPITIGERSYDGSEAVTITTADLGINENASSVTIRQWGGNA